MNLNYIQGFVEFYSVDQYQLIEQALAGLGERNFFNIVIDRRFAYNHGSIIIPFAKSYRSDGNDREFLNQNLNELIKSLIDIGPFCIDVILDQSKSKSIRFNAFFDGNMCSTNYLIFDVIQSKEKRLTFQNDYFDIDFIK
jgi:hypothetical protein